MIRGSSVMARSGLTLRCPSRISLRSSWCSLKLSRPSYFYLFCSITLMCVCTRWDNINNFSASLSDNTEFYNQKRAKTYEFLSNQKSRSLIAMVVAGPLDNCLLVRSIPLAHLYDVACGRTRAIYEKRISSFVWSFTTKLCLICVSVH